MKAAVRAAAVKAAVKGKVAAARAASPVLEAELRLGSSTRGTAAAPA